MSGFTILYSLQIKDAIHDGLRAVYNTMVDGESDTVVESDCKLTLSTGALIPGAGAFEVAAHVMLKKSLDECKGRARLGAEVSLLPICLNSLPQS